MGINGTITVIGFRLDNVSESASYDNLKVTIGQTAGTTLGSASFSGNMDGEQTLYNASSGGTAYNMVHFSGNAAQYPSRYGYQSNATSDTPAGVTNGVLFMRFTVR